VAGGGATAAGGAARMVGPARAAAGAGSGRPPTPPTPQGPATTPTPSNDNPSPPGPRRPSGEVTRPSSQGADGVGEPAMAWRPPTASDGTASGTAADAAPSGSAGEDATGRSPGRIAAEAEAARADFHRAAARPATAGGSQRGRSAALQAFFVANAGRGLLPSGETSGALSPNLKTEES
ncbi:MAG: P-type conjugative transfer protein TrbL, partial [Caulobacterales bacterium]|nr:P-type conjugative transfer protein TrbL [Caulobacterales bacterium]